MTYEGHSTRSANRVMVALVIVTILIVAYWATNGGLEEIPAEPGTVSVDE